MTDIPIRENRAERYGKTKRKSVTLTVEAIEVIQAYAERHELFFSVAIESLALIGLGNASAELLPRLVANLLQRTLKQQFNRFAKLLSLAAITAEEVNYKTDVLLLQTIWREARLDPDNFIENMQVSADPDQQPAALVRQIRNEIGTDAHDEAVARLREPVEEIIDFRELEVADEQ